MYELLIFHVDDTRIIALLASRLSAAQIFTGVMPMGLW